MVYLEQKVNTCNVDMKNWDADTPIGIFGA